jgi:hypothetical protein
MSTNGITGILWPVMDWKQLSEGTFRYRQQQSAIGRRVAMARAKPASIQYQAPIASACPYSLALPTVPDLPDFDGIKVPLVAV